MSYETQELKDWKNDLQKYNESKKKGASELYRNPNYHPPKTHVDVKTSEYAFDPILNRYRTKEQDENYSKKVVCVAKKTTLVQKECPYDIITLNRATLEEAQSRKAYSVDNHSQPYNIITNAVRIPNHKAFRVRMKKINEEIFREYNIINNEYTKNNGEKSQKDWENKKQTLEKKYIDTHDFDPIRCNFYNNEKEKVFWENEEEKQRKIFEFKNSKVPKSYKFREPINLNHEKNIYVSEGFEAFKCKEKAKMKRYQKKYEMEKYFRNLGNQIDDRNESMKMNKFYAQRFLEEYKEGFDPITLEPSNKVCETLKHALGNKKELVREKPKPKKKFRFLY